MAGDPYGYGEEEALEEAAKERGENVESVEEALAKLIKKGYLKRGD